MDIKRIDFTALGIITIIVVVAFFVLFKESRAKVALLQQNKTLLEAKLRSADAMNLELNTIRDEINSIQRNLDSFDRQLPEEKRIHAFLLEIDGLAKKNRVALTSIVPGTVKNEALYARVPIRIEGTSGFRDFYRFLFQLENIPRITRIDHLQVRKQTKSALCSIEMELAVFVSSSRS